MMRHKPKEHDSGTPRSVTSIHREVDETINVLRARVTGESFALYGFDLDTKDPILYKMGQHLKSSIEKYLTQWYGMQVVGDQTPKFIIANEADPKVISEIVAKTAGQRSGPSIVVLCSQSSQFDRVKSIEGSKASVGFVAKPVGPLKLARAIMQCLDGGPPASDPSPPPLGSHQSSNGDLSNIFEEISSIPNHGEVLDNSRMAADSDNARKALESPTPNAIVEKASEFPFGMPSDPTTSGSHPTLPSPTKSKRSSLVVPIKEPKRSSVSSSSTITSTPPLSSSSSLPLNNPTPQRRSPTLLLVDDNKINLSLLSTYMQKRKYELVHQAENGLEAVQKVQERPEGYDIIFMDISMPVLDGFGATRQIRALEESRRRRAAEAAGDQCDNSGPPLSQESVFKGSSQADDNANGGGMSGKEKDTGKAEGALVIALTGLASSSDQSEAFTSGIDLFLTKPVAFREVGKLLDNWEANQEREEGWRDV